MVGQTDARTEKSNLSTTPRAAGLGTEAGREDAAAVRCARYPGPCPDDGGGPGSRAIFEADLQPEQYANRRDRSALDAVRHVHQLISTGHVEIVDADLASYFDSLPHSELLKSVARRVVDGAMLHLIKMWLTAPVEETDERGKKHRNTRNRDEGRGSPQGSPISPLLSNLYMRRFVLGAFIVNLADDLVICCRGRGEQALAAMQVMMTKLKLTVNEAKTRVAKLPEEKFWEHSRRRSACSASVGRSATKPGGVRPYWTTRLS
jgi:hypothetical protein